MDIAKEWLKEITSDEMSEAAHTLYKWGQPEAGEAAGRVADDMEILTDIQSYEGFDKLVDWVLTDMAVGASDAEGPLPPDPEWLLKQGEDQGYAGEAMTCLRDILNGNGYLYI